MFTRRANTPDLRMGNMAGDGDRFDVACDPLSIPNDVITPLPDPLICMPSGISLLRTSLVLRRRVSPRFASQLHYSNNGAGEPVGTDKGSRPLLRKFKQ